MVQYNSKFKQSLKYNAFIVHIVLVVPIVLKNSIKKTFKVTPFRK